MKNIQSLLDYITHLQAVGEIEIPKDVQSIKVSPNLMQILRFEADDWLRELDLDSGASVTLMGIPVIKEPRLLDIFALFTLCNGKRFMTVFTHIKVVTADDETKKNDPPTSDV